MKADKSIELYAIWIYYQLLCQYLSILCQRHWHCQFPLFWRDPPGNTTGIVCV